MKRRDDPARPVRLTPTGEFVICLLVILTFVFVWGLMPALIGAK